ncbi:hypothetical protein Airi02_075720 [Actinoallomurus iriomotensis]|uniref:Uncharacterized protein n=1 Tax=Actinoallomurus iriomotensis TaxID=478107 RepID=A0A9W6S9R3_9ACTN|nr:hypothetical protein Airi02_075720 [Actinoallomurus iriomotensis]
MRRITVGPEGRPGTFEKLQAGDAAVFQESTEQPYGVHGCAFRDPAGNMVLPSGDRRRVVCRPALW